MIRKLSSFLNRRSVYANPSIARGSRVVKYDECNNRLESVRVKRRCGVVRHDSCLGARTQVILLYGRRNRNFERPSCSVIASRSCEAILPSRTGGDCFGQEDGPRNDHQGRAAVLLRHCEPVLAKRSCPDRAGQLASAQLARQSHENGTARRRSVSKSLRAVLAKQSPSLA